MGILLLATALAACSGPAHTPTTTIAPTSSATATEEALSEGVLTEREFKTLLTLGEAQGALIARVPLTARFFDFKTLAESQDPQFVAAVDSWYLISFRTEDGTRSITLLVADYDATKDSPVTAEDPFADMKAEIPGVQIMDPPVGDASAKVEVNAKGIGSIVAFVLGDKAVQLKTVRPEGEQPLVSLQSLEKLAEIVAGKLR